MDDIRRKTRVISPADVPALDIFGAALSVLSDDSAQVVVGDQAVPPGYGVPPHIHASDDEMFYIVEGELTLTGRADGDVRVPAGSFVQLPRGVPHGFRNDTQEPARVLVILSPGRAAAGDVPTLQSHGARWALDARRNRRDRRPVWRKLRMIALELTIDLPS